MIFRVDASIDMGTGHVMRCLTLADELKGQGAEITFITRAHPGNMGGAIKKSGYGLCILPAPADTYQLRKDDVTHASWLEVSWEQDAEETRLAIGGSRPEWLIVDHYGIDARWYKVLRDQVGQIMTIDDLADRPLDCDLLLDQTYGRKEEDYKPWAPSGCQILLGSQYALLRPRFAELRPEAIEKRRIFNGINRILISLGGVDAGNVTAIALEGLLCVNWQHKPVIDVVLGRNAPYFKQVVAQAESSALEIMISTDVSDMAERMLAADLAIGAGGATSWERCCLGLPSIIISTAENQSHSVRLLQNQGSLISLGRVVDVSPKQISEVIRKLMADKTVWHNMVMNAFDITSGLGAAMTSECLNHQ